MIQELKSDLKSYGNPEKAKILSRFFKTGKGQYGEGDVFLGVKVPEQRKVANRYRNIPFDDLEELLNSEIHEHRLTALLILVEKFKKADEIEKQKIVNFYLQNTSRVNNWDLVDLSADKIIGEFLFGKDENDKSILYKFSKSDNLWQRRIAIIATFAFIKKGKFNDTLRIAEILLNDKHDLIQKAVGWMLREVGKRNQDVEEDFLKKHYKKMPRTMLRYAIERFDAEQKRFYMG